VAGDASSRCYFRLCHGKQSYILAESPPATEKNQAFLDIRDLLARESIAVPDLYAADLDRGYLLLEDFGRHLLLDALDPASVDGYYQCAYAVLLRLAELPVAPGDLPRYDEAVLREELQRFPEWFASQMLSCALDGEAQELFLALSRLLIDSALEQPTVFVHRDFHSRNLMLLPREQLGLIDFQDALLGPVTYDLVSLLRDCYIQWPTERVDAWAIDYYRKLQGRGPLRRVDEQQFLRWFDWMGLQRHLKVLGTFARLYLRDGKESYLPDLPLVVVYVQEILQRYAAAEPAFAAFGQWFSEALGPRIARQPWSST